MTTRADGGSKLPADASQAELLVTAAAAAEVPDLKRRIQLQST